MKPTTITAIQLAEFLFIHFQAAEIINDDTDELIMHEPVIPLSAVIELLKKKFDAPEPDFVGFAQTMTDEKLKQSRIKYQVAQKILAEMKRRGISQNELAQLLNKKPSHINRLLSGENMTLDTLNMFQVALGIKLLDLS